MMRKMMQGMMLGGFGRWCDDSDHGDDGQDGGDVEGSCGEGLEDGGDDDGEQWRG